MCDGNKDTCKCGCSKSPIVKAVGEPIVITFPVLIKASKYNKDRIIEFEASAATSDFEGDVITQEALLGSADYFVENGFIDIDHYAELGKNPAYFFLGIEDPESWIIGKPLEVKDLGNYRTGVKARLNKGQNWNPKLYKCDWLWQQLQKEIGLWKASVYGYPGPDTEEGGCTIGTDGTVCATRYLVKSFRWCSTALTKNPINKDLEKSVTIISAKAFAAKLGYIKPAPSKFQFNREVLRKSILAHICIDCPETKNGSNLSTYNLRGHFLKCDNFEYNQADLYALATSEMIRRLND
jgi:hypothetical protein